jgi:hypothetical protein
MRNWAKECLHCGWAINEAAFDVREMHQILYCMNFEAQLKVNKQEAPSLPGKFMSFDSQ